MKKTIRFTQIAAASRGASGGHVLYGLGEDGQVYVRGEIMDRTKDGTNFLRQYWLAVTNEVEENK